MDKLRVAVLAPPWFAVPPTGYGGIEWVVSLLADGLADAGHDVTLFASGDSRTRAKLHAVFETAPSELIGRTFWELQHVISCYERYDQFDVINDHSGPPSATIGGARIILHRSVLGAAPAAAAPGVITAIGPLGVDVTAGDGASVRVTELQAEGGRRLAAAAFLTGHSWAPGMAFDLP